MSVFDLSIGTNNERFEEGKGRDKENQKWKNKTTLLEQIYGFFQESIVVKRNFTIIAILIEIKLDFLNILAKYFS